jgi:hypothetical protein
LLSLIARCLSKISGLHRELHFGFGFLMKLDVRVLRFLALLADVAFAGQLGETTRILPRTRSSWSRSHHYNIHDKSSLQSSEVLLTGLDRTRRLVIKLTYLPPHIGDRLAATACLKWGLRMYGPTRFRRYNVDRCYCATES